jgi:hypothetical protein
MTAYDRTPTISEARLCLSPKAHGMCPCVGPRQPLDTLRLGPRRLSLPAADGQVLGVDLKSS